MNLAPADQLVPALLMAALTAVVIIAVLRLLETVAKYLIPLAVALYLVLGDGQAVLENLGTAALELVKQLVYNNTPELSLASTVQAPKAATNMQNLEFLNEYGLEVTRTAIEVFAAHAVVAAVSVAILYLVMETWYPAVVLALPGLPALIAWGETFLWNEAAVYLPVYLYHPQAALGGAVVGALAMIAVGEPQIQKRTENSRSNGILEEL